MITGTTVTIERLTPSTFYDVEVRAKNAEGATDWSNSGNGSTNAPGANNPPVFSEGATATRSVSATASAGTSIGLPVAAMDADSGDTLTYSLEGRDAGLFDINDTSGQLLTKSGISLIAGETYTVVVAADDETDIARISVSIEATAAPPNNPPVFSAATATRSVSEDAAAGTNVGSPVSATDADPGDTLTYALGGADAASFTIVAASGQIRTSAALDYETKASYTVTVTANDGTVDSVPITVTINVTQVVVAVFDCAKGAVADQANTGLVGDCEALLSARNRLEGNARLNWSDVRPIAEWDGVYLRGTPTRVTLLLLNGMGLSGTVAAELGDLPMLTQLNIRTNELTGGIPAELNKLRNLTVLNLHSNMLTGPIPDLSKTMLEELYLPNNMLTGPVPVWLNRMTNMRELWLWGNMLTGTIPDLSRMTSLEKLKLAANNLTGGIPETLSSMSNLKWLIIQENPLGGPIPDLSGMTSLTHLWIHTNGLTGAVPASLGTLSNLDDLNLRNNMLTGEIPDLSGLDDLTRLRLHRNMLSGEIPDTLGGLDSLRQLWLHGNRLTGGIPMELGELADTLVEIGLKENTFDANACVPTALANVPTNDYVIAGLSVCGS